MASLAKPSGADTSYWIKFFTECDIPPSEATNYAITFTDNRIQKDMLMDLNKEYLTEMGITVLGDVIAILKHAKTIHSQLAREKALQGTNNISATPRRQTAASRTVNHYIGKDPEAAPMNLPMVPKLSKELTARLGGTPSAEGRPYSVIKDVVAQLCDVLVESHMDFPKVLLLPIQGLPLKSGLRSTTIKLSKKLEEVVPVPKKRRVFPHHEGKYKITMPSGKTQKTKKILAENQGPSTSKSSVFDRLGSETRLTTVTDSGLVISSPSEGSVFNRLGGKKAVKREATSTSIDLESDEEDELEYAGIFKSSPSPVKKQRVTLRKDTVTIKKQVTNVKKQPIVNTQKKPVVRTEGILSEDAELQLNKKIRDRLGKKSKNQEVTSTTEDPVVVNKSGAFNRLGPKKAATATKKTASPVGVFGRLGKQVSSST